MKENLPLLQFPGPPVPSPGSVMVACYLYVFRQSLHVQCLHLPSHDLVLVFKVREADLTCIYCWKLIRKRRSVKCYYDNKINKKQKRCIRRAMARHKEGEWKEYCENKGGSALVTSSCCVAQDTAHSKNLFFSDFLPSTWFSWLHKIQPYGYILAN